MNTKIGKTQKVPLRKLWKREGEHFSRWLKENIDYLTDVLDFGISIESRETHVGPFYVGLYGVDDNGSKVAGTDSRALLGDFGHSDAEIEIKRDYF